MPEFLAGLTVFVHCPDRPEPFGRSLVEAMATGVPVIAAAGAGAEEVVGKAASVCPLGDETCLSVALLDLLTDSEARLERARAGIAQAQLYDERTYAQCVADVIRHAASRRTRP
jgi:glycosyltransferase involved in cell wall biosynthesis